MHVIKIVSILDVIKKRKYNDNRDFYANNDDGFACKTFNSRLSLEVLIVANF